MFSMVIAQILLPQTGGIWKKALPLLETEPFFEVKKKGAERRVGRASEKDCAAFLIYPFS